MLENDNQNLVGSLQQMVQQIEGLDLSPQKQGHVFVLTVVQVWVLIIMR